MNEQELKNLWQTEQSAPTIDFARLQKILDGWQAHLRRRVTIDIVSQIGSVSVVLFMVWRYPKLFFVFIATVALAVWYIYSTLAFYRLEKEMATEKNVRNLLGKKLSELRRHILLSRIIFYAAPIVLVPVSYYVYDVKFNGALIIGTGAGAMISALILCEIVSIILTEVCLRIFYSAAVRELENLIDQLNSEV